MIKWAGYGKSLKLLSFGLLISFFTLFVGSSVNAGLQEIGLDGVPSQYDSNFDITFLKGGGLKTLYLGQGKGIIAFNNSSFFRWTPDGRPYFYDTDSVQGFFGEYWACSELTGGSTGPTNCSSTPIDGDYADLFVGFFSHVNAGDLAYYKFTERYSVSSSNGSSNGNFVNVCWSSSELHASLCFRRGYCYSSSAYGCDENYGTLTGSQHYTGLNFSNIPRSSIGYAPGQNGYNGNYGGSEGTGIYGDVDGFLTGSIITQECTVGYAKNYAENLGLNRFVCYGGLDIDASQYAVATAGTGASVFQIFQLSNNGLNFSDWFIYWNNIYKNRYVYDSSVWSGTPASLYPYFQFYNEYGSQFSAREIQDYCKIIVNNMSLTGIWNGNKSRCPSIVGNNVGGGGGFSRGDDDFSGGIGGGGGGGSTFNNVISVNWDGVGNHSTNEVKTPSAYITDFFNKARDIIPTNFTGIGGGFLPTYIIIFFCAIILFRFLRH